MIGASLSEPHTSVTALRTCVCMYVCTVCLRPYIPYSGKFSRSPIFAEGQSSKISRSNFRRWPFQNCSAHNTWLTPPLTACTRRLKNSGVSVLPGSYATFLQNELLSIKDSILSSVFSYLKSGEKFS